MYPLSCASWLFCFHHLCVHSDHRAPLHMHVKLSWDPEFDFTVYALYKVYVSFLSRTCPTLSSLLVLDSFSTTCLMLVLLSLTSILVFSLVSGTSWRKEPWGKSAWPENAGSHDKDLNFWKPKEECHARALLFHFGSNINFSHIGGKVFRQEMGLEEKLSYII